MTYADHTTNYRRFQAAIICERCHALHENCPHHRRRTWRNLLTAMRGIALRWRREREQQELAKLRRQIAALNAQLSEAEGRLDSEIAKRKNAEQALAREKLARAGYLATLTPGKSRAKG